MRIETIDEGSTHLKAVIALGRAHSDTLGFLPQGGFRDYARERHIIVATDDTGHCVGYLLYRIVRDKVIIAHFCVDKTLRRQGYARAMLNELIQLTKQHRGMMLSCRRDYEASKTWPRLGFHPIGERPGRAKDSELVIWWQGHGHRDLFSATEQPGAMKAAVDCNIFIDLVEQQNEESLGLTADWLRPFVTICYTAELLTEINRNKDAATRRRRKAAAQQFAMLDCSAQAYHRAERELIPLFPGMDSDQDESDFRHLVRAMAAEADVFVTRDDGILGKADEVFKIRGLAIVRPGELATQIDTLQQEHLYHRNQVAGTNQVFQARIVEVDDSLIAAIKVNNERSHELKEPLYRCLANPQRFNCHKITGRDGNVLSAYVIDRQSQVDRIPIFRVCDKRRAPTLARAVLTGIIRDAVRAGSTAILITDRQVDSAACADLGFLSVPQGQLKVILSGWLSIEEASSRLAWDDPQVAKLASALAIAKSDAIIAAELEHLLWPGKLSDSALPSFIVPIQPKFAEHLFDGRLASGTLFGADVDLALNPESAYYRAARPAVVTCPARVLWYVCQSDRYQGTMSIRACSRIIEVVRGAPKQLFKRFRRLGVYEWADVLETAGSIDKEIMAFRFDDTEPLRPLAWDDFQPVLKGHGIKTTFQSPVAIPSELFGELYVASLDSSPIR